MTEYKWRDIHGDSGRLSSDPDDLIISIELHEGKEGYAAHDIPIAEARALYAALGHALDEVDTRRPTTDSISATLAACSSPVPEILSRMCTANQRVTVEARADGMPVYKVPKSLRDVSVEELAKLGLKLGRPTQYKMRCGSCGELLHVGPESDPSSVFALTNGLRHDRCEKPVAPLKVEPAVTIPDSLANWKAPGINAEQPKGHMSPKHQPVQPSQPEPPPAGSGASTLHPRPFFWDGVGIFGFVNHIRLPPAERHDLDWLLAAVPNALDAKEADGSALGIIPGFGFRPHHTGPRTLREYLETP